MDCKEIKELTDEYITGELSEETAESVKEHLALCEDCQREYRELKALKSELAALKEEPPADLRERLIKRLKGEKRRRIFAGLGLISTAAAAAVLICVIGVGNSGGYSAITEDRIKTADVEQAQEAAKENSVADAGSGLEEGEPQEENSLKNKEVTQAVTAEKQIERESAPSDKEEKARAAVTESSGAEETARAEAQRARAALEDNTAAEEEQRSPGEGSSPSPSSSLGLSSSSSASSSSDLEFGAEEGAPLTEEDSLDYREEADEAPAMDSPESINTEINSAADDSLPAEAAPQLRASGAAAPAPASVNEEIRLILNEGDKEALKEKISGLNRAENISSTENEITFRINGLAYGELKAALKDFDLVEENTLPENTADYSVRISLNK